jgi:hypothetical protein
MHSSQAESISEVLDQQRHVVFACTVSSQFKQRSCDHPWAWKNVSTDEAEVKGWTQLEMHQSLVSKVINFVHFFLSFPYLHSLHLEACSTFWDFCVVFYKRYWALFSPQVKDKTCFSWCRQRSPLMLLSLWRDEVYELCKTWELWRSLHIVDGSRIPNQNGRHSIEVVATNLM